MGHPGIFLSPTLSPRHSSAVFSSSSAPAVALLEGQADGQEAQGEKAGKPGLYPVAVESG
jgi:hypothetical protein